MRKTIAAALGTWLGVATLGAYLPACVVTSDPAGGHGTGALRGSSIPADFKFATTRSVDLTLSAAPSLWSGAASAGLQVERADGRVLFEGALHPLQSLKLRLAVPTKDQLVKLTLRAPGIDKSERVTIAGDAVVHAFQ